MRGEGKKKKIPSSECLEVKLVLRLILWWKAHTYGIDRQHNVNWFSQDWFLFIIFLYLGRE